MKNNHQILFIFPPVASPVSPYLSTPLLAGQLSNNGFNTTCLDLSVEFFNHILKREYILNAYNIAKNEYINLKSIIGNKSSNDNDFLTYPFENKKQIFKKEAIEKYVQNEKKIIEEVENIDFAIHSYKNKNDFYNPELMQKASDIINTAFEIIMLQYFPAQLFFHKYTNIEYKSTYKALEYQALQNNNIFYDFYKQKIDEHNIKNYDLICISCPNQTQILPSMILARMIKEQSNAKIVLGGNIVSRIDKNLQKIDKIFNSFFDFIISGCGEKSLIKLAEHIFYKKGNLNNIKGLLYKNKNQIKLNKPDKNYNINNSSFMSLNGIDLNNYLTPEIIMPIQLSKGCYWGKCTFCGLHYPPKKFTIKNPEKVVDEIEFLVKNHNIKTFEFIDEAIPPLYFSKLADIIIKRNIDIKYICCSRIEHKHYSKELCEKLYKSGLRLVQFGFESANENTCKIINKGIDYNKRLKTIKMFADAGIFTYLFAILGFPTEAREDGIKTINIIQDNPDIIDFLFIHQFWLDKKSIAYKKYKQIGIEKIIEDKNNPFSQKYDFEAINKEYTSNLNEIFKLYKEQRCDKKYNFFAPDEYFFLYAIHYGRKNLKEILK